MAKNNDLEVSIFKACRKIFCDFFTAITKGDIYEFDGKAGVHLKQIIFKLEKRFEHKNSRKHEAVVDITKSFTGFLELLKTLKDKWYLENLSIPNLNSKYNEIVCKLSLMKKSTPEEKLKQRWELEKKADRLINKYRKDFLASPDDFPGIYEMVQYIFTKENLDADIQLQSILTDKFL